MSLPFRSKKKANVLSNFQSWIREYTALRVKTISSNWSTKPLSIFLTRISIPQNRKKLSLIKAFESSDLGSMMILPQSIVQLYWIVRTKKVEWSSAWKYILLKVTKATILKEHCTKFGCIENWRGNSLRNTGIRSWK